MLLLPTRVCFADPGVRIGAPCDLTADQRNTRPPGRVDSVAPLLSPHPPVRYKGAGTPSAEERGGVFLWVVRC
jgi:hypothetical protein